LFVVAKLFASLAFACIAAVLAAFDVNVFKASHGLLVSGSDAGGCCQGGRLISSDGGVVSGANAGGCRQCRRLVSSDGGDKCGVLPWWEVVPELGWNSNLNGSGRHLSGGFFGGRTPLGPNLMSQLLFFAASQHFFMKVSMCAFLSPGILSFLTWLEMRWQLS
jgi:hypothetical protein